MANKTTKGERRRQQARQLEAKQTRKKYKSWKDVIKEAQYLRCGGCNLWLKISGDMIGKTCSRCGAPVAIAH